MPGTITITIDEKGTINLTQTKGMLVSEIMPILRRVFDIYDVGFFGGFAFGHKTPKMLENATVDEIENYIKVACDMNNEKASDEHTMVKMEVLNADE